MLGPHYHNKRKRVPKCDYKFLSGQRWKLYLLGLSSLLLHIYIIIFLLYSVYSRGNKLLTPQKAKSVHCKYGTHTVIYNVTRLVLASCSYVST